jgi:hypothetical protein
VLLLVVVVVTVVVIALCRVLAGRWVVGDERGLVVNATVGKMRLVVVVVVVVVVQQLRLPVATVAEPRITIICCKCKSCIQTQTDSL